MPQIVCNWVLRKEFLKNPYQVRSTVLITTKLHGGHYNTKLQGQSSLVQEQTIFLCKPRKTGVTPAQILPLISLRDKMNPQFQKCTALIRRKGFFNISSTQLMPLREVC